MLEGSLIMEIVVLLVIFYQDLKYRAVSLMAFLVLAIAGSVASYFASGIYNTLFNALVNSTIITIQLAIVYIFYLIKTGKPTNIINTKLGLGDVLMLFALSFSFSPPVFLIFIFLSFVISLFISLLRRNKQSIPLAGYQAIFYLIFITINYLFFDLNQFQFNPYN